MTKRQGVLSFQYQAEPDGDEVTAWAGLPMIVEAMKQLGVEHHVQEQLMCVKQRDSGFTPFEMVTALVLMLSAGGDCLDDIRMLREDKALCALLGHELPSADVLRRFLERFHEPSLFRNRPDEGAWIAPESELLLGLSRVNVALVQAVAKNEPTPITTATLDHDATIIEAHKKEAKAHYKEGRGYQPAIAVWAETGLVIGDEFRDGNVPAGMGNLALIARAFASLPASVTERYFRADSACYEQQLLKWLSEPSRGIGFAVSADMSPELRKACVELPREAWALYEERVDVILHVADVEFTSGNWKRDAMPLRYLALRFTPRQGELLGDGSSERYFAVVTNREGDAGALVDWHRQKAGTVELIHDVTKNELGANVLPSGKFGANAAWYRIVMLTHNVLCAMRRLVAPPELKNARPKRLRYRLFTLPAKVVVHARQLFARVAARLLDAADALAMRARLLALVFAGSPAPESNPGAGHERHGYARGPSTSRTSVPMTASNLRRSSPSSCPT